MACCDDQPNVGITIDLRDLPEETFCCMGRMSYMLAARCLELITGEKHPAYETFNELEKLKLGALAKDLAVGDKEGDTMVEKLMGTVIKAMATTI